MRHLCALLPIFLALCTGFEEEDATCEAGTGDDCTGSESEDDTVEMQHLTLDESDKNLYWLQRCNIKRISWPEAPGKMLSSKAPEPYIVSVPAGHNANLTRMTERSRMLSELGDMDCTPSEVGNIRKGRYHMTLRDYIEKWMGRPVQRNPAMNRYIFGEFGDQWKPFREAYELPKCKACTPEHTAVAVGMGGLHTGAPWHFHNAAFLEMLHGKKHVAFLPEHDPAVELIRQQITNNSQLHWYLEKRPELERQGYLTAMQECTIHAGELLFFPNQWYHGVLNLDPHTVFVGAFVDHRFASQDSDLSSS